MAPEEEKQATTISPQTCQQVIHLYQTKYYETNFSHYTELLQKREGIRLSAASVMGILESEYILSPKATKAKRKRVKVLVLDDSIVKRNRSKAVELLVPCL